MSLFMHPWFLLLLPVVPYLAWRRFAISRRSAIAYSSTSVDWEIRPTLRQRLSWLPTALALVALTLMIVAMARPREGKERTVSTSEGIAIELIVDRSSSMQALDFQIDRRPVDRLTAVKNVASEFVLGKSSAGIVFGEQSVGRKGDRIGLICFAGYADALTPPTLDHSFLVSQLKKVDFAATSNEDGTAIGDALALAVEKLDSTVSQSQQKIKSKVVILLTDGDNTAGEMTPAKSAELARSLGIKVYTIGVGTRGRAPVPVRRLSGGRVAVEYVQVNINEELLEEIASETNGKYFRATDTESLKQIYAEIDALERTEFQTDQFVDYRELAVQTLRIGAWTMPSLLMISAIFWLVSIGLNHTVFRRLV